MLSSNADFVFSESAEKMLSDKELKKKKEVEEIEALWSKAQKNIVKSKVGLADDQAVTHAQKIQGQKDGLL